MQIPSSNFLSRIQTYWTSKKEQKDIRFNWINSIFFIFFFLFQTANYGIDTIQFVANNAPIISGSTGLNRFKRALLNGLPGDSNVATITFNVTFQYIPPVLPPVNPYLNYTNSTNNYTSGPIYYINPNYPVNPNLTLNGTVIYLPIPRSSNSTTGASATSTNLPPEAGESQVS